MATSRGVVAGRYATQMSTQDEFDALYTRIDLPFPDPSGGYDRIFQSTDSMIYRLGDVKHRLDGPALRRDCGITIWYRNGKYHRSGGPAFFRKLPRATSEKYRHLEPDRHGRRSPEGREQWLEAWFEDGALHRLDGPALRWQDGTEEWLQNGYHHRIGLPAVAGADGLREWHQLAADGSMPAPNRPFDIRGTIRGRNFFREHGPVAVLASGLRFWGVGTAGDRFDDRPFEGPWIEYADGSVRFVESGHIYRRSADHDSTVALRRTGREFVQAAFGSNPVEWFAESSFIPFMNSSPRFEGIWGSAHMEARRLYSGWAVDQWDRVQGNLSHEEERNIEPWLERFRQTVNEERDEIRLWREDMAGYLGVALRRLESIPQLKLDQLQRVIDMTGLPLLGSVAQLRAESRMIRAVVTAPAIDTAVPEILSPNEVGSPLRKPKSRTARVRNELYVNGIAECALATLAAIVGCNGADLADTILLNVMVDEIDHTTGLNKRYCILSVQTERDQFKALNLARVNPLECIKNLGAVVPRGATELAPVRPIIAFDKEDARIVAATDVAARLDARANLMDLTPNEFESLIQNLFTKIGLDTHQTQASRDGGVDAIAYDSRPIFGGKIIIQAKRYKNTVGVSAVRDLYGTVLNEGASKGLLVTTSGYGKSSFEFAKNKPLELLEGGHLLHLLKEHLGMDAVIIPPVEWVDPVEDAVR